MSTAHATRPLARLSGLIDADRRDLAVLLGYTLSVGLASLAVPLTAKAMVNTVASGALLQPLFVLSAALLLALAFTGVLRALQLWMVETIQARLFARVALRMARRASRAPLSAWEGVYAPEQLNRFFDVLSVQKAWSKLLVDGPAALVQVLVGMALMAVYSPFLLGLNLLLAAGAGAVAALGRRALETSMEESQRKYEVAHWLEDAALCHASLKMHGDPAFPVSRVDALAARYLDARRAHFRILLRQNAAHYALNALALTGVFAVGGWLVVSRSLTVGQLVAAEIVVLMTVGAIDKLVTLLEPLYDLLTGLEKLAVIDELPAERAGGQALPASGRGLAIEARGLRYAYPGGGPLLEQVDLKVPAGGRVSLVGHSGVGKTTLTRLLCGLLEPSEGRVLLDGRDASTLDPHSVRRAIAVVGEESEIFAGTVEENIRAGRAWLSAEDLAWATRLTLLDPILERLPGGLSHPLVSQGKNLSLGQRQRVLIARAIVGRPRLLVFDETFTGIGESNKLIILESLLDRSMPWTILNVSHDAEIVARCEAFHLLAEGRIVESGEPSEYAARGGSLFAALFSELARQSREAR
ncbi:MAG: ATP-binding cassette domain-containing protein [Elusimicrobiota bacterium]|nr:ATP-binding cassette domain-containing protein [Elusimicrobiota bacterium]